MDRTALTTFRSLVESIIRTSYLTALMSPATTKSDVDRHTAAFREVVRSLVEG